MEIHEVSDRKGRDRFIKLPWIIYRRDRNWIPPLILERREFLDPQKNPFFDHADVKLFLAQDGNGKELGRIAATINWNHVRTHNEKAGFFGLFECVRDQSVASSLFQTAADFLRSRGMEIMRGPENLSVNDDLGLLIEGFHTPPMIMMPHNPPYYQQLVENFGFQKSMDLLAYYGEFKDGSLMERLEKGARFLKRQRKFTIRSLRMDAFKEDLARIREVYTSAWEDNWGAVAMTEREFEHLAKNLKSVIDPELCLIAEVDGEAAGFSFTLPDVNQALARMNGRLFPFGMIRFMWRRRRIDAIRVLTMGVIKKFRHRGIDTHLYYESYRRARAKGIWRSELSWILENNIVMNRIIERFGFAVYKRYRLYDLPLQAPDR